MFEWCNAGRDWWKGTDNWWAEFLDNVGFDPNNMADTTNTVTVSDIAHLYGWYNNNQCNNPNVRREHRLQCQKRTGTAMSEQNHKNTGSMQTAILCVSSLDKVSWWVGVNHVKVCQPTKHGVIIKRNASAQQHAVILDAADPHKRTTTYIPPWGTIDPSTVQGRHLSCFFLPDNLAQIIIILFDRQSNKPGVLHKTLWWGCIDPPLIWFCRYQKDWVTLRPLRCLNLLGFRWVLSPLFFQVWPRYPSH